jgi:hypothetical protein
VKQRKQLFVFEFCGSLAALSTVEAAKQQSPAGYP